MKGSDRVKRFTSWRPSAATPIAVIALVLALGGSAYATHLTVRASDIVNRAVRAKHIKPGAVKTGKLVDAAVIGAKIADGAISNTKIADGAVRNAKLAANVVTSGPFGVTVRRETSVTIGGGLKASATASCLEGERAISGGAGWALALFMEDANVILRSEASGHSSFLGAEVNPTSWTAVAYNGLGSDQEFIVSVECLVP